MAQVAPLPAISAEESEAIDRIDDLAFWQLMLVDDLFHAEQLVEELIKRLRTRLREIKYDAIVAGADL